MDGRHYKNPPKVPGPFITALEAKALRFVIEYGNGVDFGGSGHDRKMMAAVKSMVSEGCLSGSERNAALTDRGRAAFELYQKSQS